MSICDNDCVGLRPKLAYSTCYRSPNCNFLTPNWKHDPYLTYFCQKFGNFAPHVCQEVNNPCQSVHKSLESLDYFCCPPLYRKGGCEPKFRSTLKNQNLEDEPCYPGSEEACPGLPQLPCRYRPNPKPYGDVVCGICVKNSEWNGTMTDYKNGEDDPVEECKQETTCDLPFVIYPLWTCDTEAKKTCKKSGVAACLHRSSINILNSVTKTEFVDFYKLNSPEELSLYRSKLAIDKRQPRPCIPKVTPNEELDLTRPIFINAKMLKFRQKGNPQVGGTQVSVCIPGPITIG